MGQNAEYDGYVGAGAKEYFHLRTVHVVVFRHSATDNRQLPRSGIELVEGEVAVGVRAADADVVAVSDLQHLAGSVESFEVILFQLGRGLSAVSREGG